MLKSPGPRADTVVMDTHARHDVTHARAALAHALTTAHADAQRTLADAHALAQSARARWSVAVARADDARLLVRLRCAARLTWRAHERRGGATSHATRTLVRPLLVTA